MKAQLLLLTLTLFTTKTFAADFCVTGVKGTIASSFIFKLSQNQAGERMLSVLDNKNSLIFNGKTLNHLTKFNSTGYGVCSIISQGTDANGAQYNLELKVSPHYQKACTQVGLPTSVEYLTLKIIPKCTTLGDELTSYALSITPCP